MKLMSVVTALVALFLTSSCVKYDGLFSIQKKITIYHEKHGQLFARILPPANYSASLSVLGDNTVSLNFRLRDGRSVQTDMHLFSFADIPQEEGDFYISYDETRQNYDVKGHVKTKMLQEPVLVKTYESCTYYRDQYQCRRFCDSYGCYNRCRHYPVRYRGQRYVEYNKTQKVYYLTARLLMPNTDDMVASYKGKAVKPNIDYLFQGRCQ